MTDHQLILDISYGLCHSRLICSAPPSADCRQDGGACWAVSWVEALDFEGFTLEGTVPPVPVDVITQREDDGPQLRIIHEPHGDLPTLQKTVWAAAEANGWHDTYQTIAQHSEPQDVQRAYWVAAQLALIHSEVSEALQLIRQPRAITDRIDDIGAELADIVMRTLDLAESLNVDIAQAIERNLVANATRGYRHGGRLL